MRVLVAGAAGVIGRALIPRLVDKHEVVGLTRSQAGAERVASIGARGVAVDALNAAALRRAVSEVQPEVVINQLTAIPAKLNPRALDRDFETTNRLRTQGTRNLIDATADLGARHIAQSIAYAYAPGGAALKGEDDELNDRAPKAFRANVKAIAELERATLAAHGVVLRYGHFYGPGTTYATDGDTTEQIRNRKLPIVGRGRGLFSFIHIDDAADATVAALQTDGPIVLNIVDDDPAPSGEWITEIARLTAAKPPRRVPAFLAGIAAGSFAPEYMDKMRGASNVRAKKQLGWTPRYPSWRDGFAVELGSGR